MPEVPHPGKDHGQSRRIGRGDDFIIADRPARLDHGGRPGFGGGQQPVSEGEEGIGGHRAARSAGRRPAIKFRRLARLDRGDPARIAAVHLPGADPGGDAVLGIDDGVRLDVLGDRPGEQAIFQLLLARLALLIIDEAHQVVPEANEATAISFSDHSNRSLRLENLVSRILARRPDITRIALTAVAGGASGPVARWIEGDPDADAVGVRDRQTLAQLHAAGIAAHLMPDPAVLTAECFGPAIAGNFADVALQHFCKK